MTEWDAFAAGLFFLQNNDSVQPLCPEPSATGVAAAMEIVKPLMKLKAKIEKFSDKKVGDVDPAEKNKQAGATNNNEPPENPRSSTDTGDQEKPAEHASACLLVMTGSSSVWLKVGGQGPTKTIDMSPMTGCTFVALGRLLTRSNKTFLELIKLAKQGDPRKVDICFNDLKADTDQGDVYSAMTIDLPACYFGQALTNHEGDFKDADLMASLLDFICREFIRETRLFAQVNGLEKVYLAGNFVSNDHVRSIITRDMILFKVYSGEESGSDIRFLRHGGYLGAIGTMMDDVRKSTNKG